MPNPEVLAPHEPGKLAIETPAGRVDVDYSMSGEYVDSIRLFNVAVHHIIWCDDGHNTIFVDDKDPLRHGFQLA